VSLRPVDCVSFDVVAFSVAFMIGVEIFYYFSIPLRISKISKIIIYACTVSWSSISIIKLNRKK
jgi:hypothetical protein